jgi:alkaline phosphatase
VDHRYRIDVEAAGKDKDEPLELISPDNPLAVAAGKSATATIFVEAAPRAFDDGRREVRFRISDGAGWSDVVPYRLLGPEAHEEREHKERHEK